MQHSNNIDTTQRKKILATYNNILGYKIAGDKIANNNTYFV